VVGLSLAGLRPTGFSTWSGGDLVTSLLLIPVIRTDGRWDPLVAPGWTLSYELMFYIVFGALLMIPDQRKRVAGLVGTFATIALAGALTRPASFTVRHMMEPIILEFCGGCLLGYLYLHSSIFERYLGGRRGWALIVLGLGGLAFNPNGFTEFVFGMGRLIGFGLPALLIVAGALALERAGRRADSPFLNSQGEASYAIYLMHMLALQFAFKVMNAATTARSKPISIVMIVLACVVAGLVGTWVHYKIEKPLSRLLHRLLPGPAARSIAARSLPSVG
jgi:exopolysaccharide production protein ExoZ